MKTPKAQEIQLWDCNLVWWLREGVGRGLAWSQLSLRGFLGLLAGYVGHPKVR